MAETSSKKLKPSGINLDEDRLSSLPEPLVHHIMSFLDMSDVMETPLLSKRWRYVWVSLPYLNFDEGSWIEKKVTQKDCKLYRGGVRFDYATAGYSLMGFFNNVLHFRDNSNIKKFSLDLFAKNCEEQFDKLITSVARKDPQEVDFNIFSTKPIELPHCFFMSRIEIFKFEMDLNWNAYALQLPSSMCSAAHLKTLKLVSAILPRGDSDGVLVFSSPVLENLSLDNCDHRHLKVMNICGVQLKNLVIRNEDCSNCWSCKIKICTPNLTSFQCRGDMYEDYCLENLSSLVDATLECLVNVERRVQYFVNILKEIYNVTNLTLLVEWTRNMSLSPAILEQLPNRFHNLRILKLTRWSIHHAVAIANILEISPNAERVVWKLSETRTRTRRADKGGECTVDLPSKCMLYHLKYFEIQNLKGCDKEFKFLEFILKNAFFLENLSISTTNAASSGKEKELEEFSKKLQSLSRSSLSVSIFFLLRSKT